MTSSPPKAHSPRVLIVCHAAEAAEPIAASLTADGYSCEVVSAGDAATQSIADEAFDIVICDLALDAGIRADLLDLLSRSRVPLPVVIATSLIMPDGAAEEGAHVAVQYLTKPSTLSTLEAVMHHAVDEQLATNPPPVWKAPTVRAFEFDRMPSASGASPKLLGGSRAMTSLRERIDHVAASTAPVLIAGEKGSGKEVIAHAIHSEGPRRDRPFVAINVGAIPAELLESEIFGHVRGAFNAATEARRGLLLAAQGGTLFLDEIADVPLSLQAKLLCVIEMGEVRAVGSDSARAVDVRIICASHRDLPKLVAECLFQEDLYLRLNVLRIEAPPLRDRREDIGELALNFLQQARTRTVGSPVRSISLEALAFLASAEWPGNVRELATTIERAVVFGDGETITRENLSTSHDELVRVSEGPTMGLAVTTVESRSGHQLTDNRVAWVLTHTDEHKGRAALILGR